MGAGEQTPPPSSGALECVVAGRDQPKAARELSRAALEMNCRVSPVPFLLASLTKTKACGSGIN